MQILNVLQVVAVDAACPEDFVSFGLCDQGCLDHADDCPAEHSAVLQIHRQILGHAGRLTKAYQRARLPLEMQNHVRHLCHGRTEAEALCEVVGFRLVEPVCVKRINRAPESVEHLVAVAAYNHAHSVARLVSEKAGQQWIYVLSLVTHNNIEAA